MYEKDKIIYRDAIWQHAAVTKELRNKQNNHKSFALWFTGLPCSGKTTLSNAIEEILFQKKIKTFGIDGDNIRFGLSSNLGFSEKDRKENIRRTGEVVKLMLEAGVVTLVAMISPYREDRKMVRSMLDGEFVEIYCKAKLKSCEARDVKGLYKKARNNEIKNYTGISSPYEYPETPELIIDTDVYTIEESVKLVLNLLQDKKYL
jgi:adenylylsulfate kinase